VHLKGICVGQTADFKSDNDKAVQAAMGKEQVDPIPFVANAQSPQ